MLVLAIGESYMENQNNWKSPYALSALIIAVGFFWLAFCAGTYFVSKTAKVVDSSEPSVTTKQQLYSHSTEKIVLGDPIIG
jgi:hypothetical protein